VRGGLAGTGKFCTPLDRLSNTTLKDRVKNNYIKHPIQADIERETACVL
jgi:hypothetical protein